MTRTSSARSVADDDTDEFAVVDPRTLADIEGFDDGPPDGGGAARRKLALSGGLWSAASQLIPALGTAVLSVAAGRYLGSEALGQQSLIAYVNSAVSAVLIYSLNTALLQIGGRLQGQGDARSLRALTRWSIGAHMATGGVVFATMGISALLVGNNHLAWAVIGVVSILDATVDGMAVRLILAEGWGPLGRLRLVFQLLGPPLGIVLLFAGFGITGIFVGDGLAALGLLVAVLLRYRRRSREDPTGAAMVTTGGGTGTGTDLGGGSGPPAPAAAPAAVWRLRGGVWAPLVPRRHRWAPVVPVAAVYGLFAVDALITQVVSRRVEFVVLAIFSTDTQIGMYSVAFMAVNLVAMIPLGVAAAAMPIIAAAQGRGESDASAGHLRMALRIGSIVSIPFVALLASVGPSAVTLVYGSAYADAARLVPLASVGLLVAVISGVCSQFWAGQGRLKVVLLSGLVAAVADLGVAFALIPRYDALGAVFANLAGAIAFAASLVVATVRLTGPIGWRVAGLGRALVVGVAGAAAVYGVSVVARRVVPGVELRALAVLAVGSIAFVVVALVVVVVCRLFDRDEADWLRPLVPRRLRGLLDRLTVGAGT